MIQSDEEFDRLADGLEALDALAEERELDLEERELQTLLAHLCTEYEDRTVEPPASTPLIRPLVPCVPLVFTMR